MTRRLLLVVAALLAAGRVEAQPFLYSLRNVVACPATGACPGPRLLVTNVRTGEIVNPDDPELFPGDEGVATALAIGANGSRAYVSIDPFYRDSTAPPRVLILSLATYRPVGSIAVPVAPWFLVPSPDGRLLYGSSPQDDLVMVFDLAANQLARSLTVEHAFSMVLTADSATLAVVQPRPSRVSLIDTVSGTERLGVAVPRFPQQLAMSPDGSQVYVATSEATASGNVVTIDTGTGAVETRAVGPWPVGKFLPMPNNAKVYATFTSGGMWGVMKPPPDLTVFEDAVAPSGQMVPSDDWSRIFIEGTNGVLVVNTTTDTVEARLPGGSSLAAAPAGGCQFVLPPQDAVFGPSGGTGTIQIPAPAGCEWAVQNAPEAGAVQVTSAASGIGPATLTYAVLPGSSPRATGIRIAGQTTRLSVVVPDLSIDAPAAGALVRAPFTVSGWTIEKAVGASGPGIDAVHAWAFPSGGGTPVFLGVADYGASRLDVGAAFGSAYANSGFNLFVPWLEPGTYHIAVYGHSAAAGAFTTARVVTVTVAGERRAMALDGPIDLQAIDATSGTIRFAGWAFDRAAPAGAGVDAIHVWAFPVEGGAPRFLGTGTVGVERPDVAAAYGERFRDAGFFASLPKPPPGTYSIAVYAHSAASGQFDQWRVVRVVVQ